eukprot:scpid19332/ scgid20650/ 
MSASKRHLYRSVDEARDLQNVSSAGEFLRQGQQFKQLDAVSPAQGRHEPVPVTQEKHAEPVKPSSAVSPGPLLDFDDLLLPRSTAPRQHLSPVRSRPAPSDALTPSDEEDLPDARRVTGHAAISNVDPFLMGPQVDTQNLPSPLVKPALLDGVECLNNHDTIAVETLDSAVGSGEVPVSSSVTRSPVKVVRHSTDRLGSVPVSQAAVSHSLVEISHTPAAATEITDSVSPVMEQDSTATRKASNKPKGRYVASRYMQAPSKPAGSSRAASTTANKATKPSPPTNTVAKSMARPSAPQKRGIGSSKPGHVASTVESSAQRGKPVKALAGHSSRSGIAASQKQPRAGQATVARSSGPMSYRTPHHLPAEQALLRARQAMADSIFTPSLQPPSYTTGHVPTEQHTARQGPTQTPTVAKSSGARPASGSRVGSGQRGSASTPAAAVPSSTRSRPSRPDRHQSTACYARSMQWAFLAARAEHNLKTQEKAAEQQIHAVWQEVESLQRQETEYLQQLASLENAKLLDSVVYSQLGSLRSITGSLDKLADSHGSLADALTTVYHQLPVKGIVLPNDMTKLTDALEQTEEVLEGAASSLVRPVGESGYPGTARTLDSLRGCVEEELVELKETKLLLEKACRLQTSLASLAIHDVQVHSE